MKLRQNEASLNLDMASIILLLYLPYFDPIRMTIIDPMHNIYLGSAKRLLKVWMGQGLISVKSLDVIQSWVNAVYTPSYVCRIPYKVASLFAELTADQFKNWANYFSIMVLYDILPNEHMQCWRYFVQASRILCQISFTDAEI